MTVDEMAEWHHRLNGHEFEQTPGDGEGQGSLAHCSPWVAKSDTTEQLNDNMQHVESCFPHQESNLRPLHWKHGVLTTGPPQKSCT